MKLLFVDDEQTFLKYLTKRLVLEGFEVKVTFSGEEGVEVASKEDFDVAVVDLQMPGMDGIEVQNRLKDLQHPTHVYQLSQPELPSEFPSLSSMDALPHNLPLVE